MVVEDPESLPYGGVYRGFAGMWRESRQSSSRPWRIGKSKTERVIGSPDGDDFVLVQRMTGRAVSTGRAVEMSILEHYTFRDDLLVSIQPYYWDTKALIDILRDG